MLCIDGAVVYDAQILAIKEDENPALSQYKVHYKGWAKKWDKFVALQLLLEPDAAGNPDTANPLMPIPLLVIGGGVVAVMVSRHAQG